MLIPIGTDHSERRVPWITLTLVLICFIVFGLQSQAYQQLLESTKMLDRSDDLQKLLQGIYLIKNSTEYTYGFWGNWVGVH